MSTQFATTSADHRSEALQHLDQAGRIVDGDLPDPSGNRFPYHLAAAQTHALIAVSLQSEADAAIGRP